MARRDTMPWPSDVEVERFYSPSLDRTVIVSRDHNSAGDTSLRAHSSRPYSTINVYGVPRGILPKQIEPVRTEMRSALKQELSQHFSREGKSPQINFVY